MAKQRSNRSSSAAPARTYRPTLDRLIFGAALIGVLATVHLFIQQGRGFDQGCFGFSASEAVEATFDCAAVTESAISSPLGVSNAVWGILYYAFIASLTFVLIFLKGQAVPRAKLVRLVAVSAAFLYTAYLVYYQLAVIGEMCALCLTSAGIETVLLALVAVDFFRAPRPVSRKSVNRFMTTLKTKREAGILASLAVVLVLLVGADFYYFSQIPTAALVDDTTLTAEAVPGIEEGAAAVGPQECGYNPDYPPAEDYMSLISFMDPSKGNPEAPVKIIEFFDPNCPHCKTLYPIMEEVIAEYGDQAQVFYKVFVIWQHSVAQGEALYAAAQEGKFFDMLEQQFAVQNPRGLSAEQLRRMAADIGMNADVMMQRLQGGIFRPTLQGVRQQGMELGISSVPTVMINGRVVASQSRSVECLGELIEREAAAARAGE